VHLRPDDLITDRDLLLAQRYLVRDAAWSSVCGALFGGVVLASFALSLGAGTLVIGLLAAIPFMVQALQLPATLLVERLRQRKRIGVVALTLARTVILAMAVLPWLPAGGPAIALLLLGQLAICGMSAVAACANNSWFHQLLPARTLGSFFSRRLAIGTVLGCAFTLATGWLLEHPPEGRADNAYAIAFGAAGLAGLASSWYLARCAEPRMTHAGPSASMRNKLAAPFRDRNFRHLLVLIASWSFASNFAAPFLTVYLIQQLGYGMATVTGLWVVSQAANALTLFLWGRVSDRLSNKAVLSVALPTFFACTLALVFTRVGTPYGMALPLLYLVHAVMGAAGGGVGLATGNIGLKLAPPQEATSYLAAVGLISSVAGGLSPLIAGSLGEWLHASQFSLVLRWVSSSATHELSFLRFAHLEFLFAIAALLGLYVMHALSRVEEGAEVSERRVAQELLLEALRSVNHLSSAGGLLTSIVAFDRLTERRSWFRHRGHAGSATMASR
jgi:Major Facilitator Superfamily